MNSALEPPIERAARGAALLKQGRYREGFPLFDAWREAPGNTNRAPALPFRRWRGEDVSGKRILVWSEHGYGDQIMYARFAKLLVERGADVTWACPAPLARLLRGLGVKVLADDAPFEISDVDFYCPSSALPLGFDLTPATVPAAPYFHAPANLKGRIGVMTAGSAANPARSLPPDCARLLFDLPDAFNLAPGATGAKDFYDTATIIAGAELIITVDTAVAHLAGAMGKPTWVLLPFDADWRWALGERTPWYSTARLYRHDGAGWAGVINQIKADLSVMESARPTPGSKSL